MVTNYWIPAGIHKNNTTLPHISSRSVRIYQQHHQTPLFSLLHSLCVCETGTSSSPAPYNRALVRVENSGFYTLYSALRSSVGDAYTSPCG